MFRKSCGTNRTNKAGGRKKNQTNKPSASACDSQARPPHCQGRGLNKRQKAGGARIKRAQRQRGRFLGAVLCPHRHGTSPRGINMQQLLAAARERVCSSVFSPIPTPIAHNSHPLLLITVAFSLIPPINDDHTDDLGDDVSLSKVEKKQILNDGNSSHWFEGRALS